MSGDNNNIMISTICSDPPPYYLKLSNCSHKKKLNFSYANSVIQLLLTCGKKFCDTIRKEDSFYNYFMHYFVAFFNKDEECYDSLVLRKLANKQSKEINYLNNIEQDAFKFLIDIFSGIEILSKKLFEFNIKTQNNCNCVEIDNTEHYMTIFLPKNKDKIKFEDFFNTKKYTYCQTCDLDCQNSSEIDLKFNTFLLLYLKRPKENELIQIEGFNTNSVNLNGYKYRFLSSITYNLKCWKTWKKSENDILQLICDDKMDVYENQNDVINKSHIVLLEKII